MGVVDVIQNALPLATWAAQTAWFVDGTNGLDSNSGIDSGHSLKTWNEFRRRMVLAGGHTTDGTTITYVNLADTMIVDWGTKGQINMHVQGTPVVVRTGSLTSAPTNRNPVTRQANVLTDSAVSSWASELSINTGYMIRMTSGTASGRSAFIAKDLGSHQVRVSTFTRVEDILEVFPSNGDTYEIISMPFVQDYQLVPTSGVWLFKYMNIGDTNSVMYNIAPAVACQAMQFTYCSIYYLYSSQCTIYMVDSCLKTTPNFFTGTLEIFAGLVGDISGSPLNNEIETAAELYLDTGALFQGVGMNIINLGYCRAVDAMFFDSPSSGITIGTGGVLRSTILSGSGNAQQGVYVSSSGTVIINPATCYITGAQGDIYFCGIVYTWASIIASDGLKSASSIATITSNNKVDGAFSNQIGLLNTVTGISLKATGVTTLYTVPTGKSCFIDDTRFQPTTATAVTIPCQISIGGNSASFDDWASGYGLSGSDVLNEDLSMKNFIAAQGVSSFGKIYPAGTTFKLNVQVGATATANIVTARIFGMLF